MAESFLEHRRNRSPPHALARAGLVVRDFSVDVAIFAHGAAFRARGRKPAGAGAGVDWSRRVLGQGAVVLFISDGLDCDDPALLAREMERLHLCAASDLAQSADALGQFFPARAVFAPCCCMWIPSAAQSIASLEALAEAISDSGDRSEKARLLALLDD